MARILVIDDDALYREMVQEALIEDGYETISAENGRTGLDRARAYLPDLIVCDIVMEHMDGFELLAAIRNDPTTSSIPLIMITGWSTKGNQRQGMSLGADDFLSKPFNASELCEAVRAQLSKRNRASSVEALAPGTVDTFTASLLPAEIHDPVQSILSFARILDSGHDQLDRRELRAIARHVEKAALRIRKAGDNFLLYTQLSALENEPGTSEQLTAATTADVGPLILDRVQRIAASFDRKDDLSSSITSGNAAIGRTYLIRIIDELTTNAFMFSDSGSPVEVTSAFSPDRFGFAVSDRGRGMSSEHLGAVNAFVQFGVRETGQPGLGLGLAVVRKIATLHGGTLLIKSKFGERTRVSVELPRRKHV